MARIGIFGEVLFDHFPDGTQVLGGAPFNVAWHLQALGAEPQLISRVGDDAEGNAVRSAMAEWGMDTATLETDPGLPTGRVSVEFADGEPAYEIVHPVAFDAIAAQPSPSEFDWLYHGSLALRADASRQALDHLASTRIFVDVNLRSPWWSRETVLDRVRQADWVKLNVDELEELTGERSDRAAKGLVESCDLDGLLLTSGSRGARVLTGDGEAARVAPRRQIKVIDTVGAGDAFAAITILGLTREWPLDDLLERAQQFASAVCGQRGATVRDHSFYARFLTEWELEKATD